MAAIVLKGITWGHSRGYTPAGATASDFRKYTRRLKVFGRKDTLQEFADYPIEN